MRFRVEKLIRDKLPAIMRDQGLAVFDRRLDDAAFDRALRAKLLEEAAEAVEAVGAEDLAGELADLSEVILALAQLHGLGAAEIEARRIAKRAERGGFDDRVYNAAVEAEDGLPAADYYLARPDQYPREP
ncbi:nucleoside triphosphate pyrophosphohydrolase [Phenylobacterium aquaticum]|uniref:nucleoside triphosphate pyrophosphohydrolase n=1 Tax=Phenylobacterium aquaticum TaxID=1763816 RepID=UPI001F5CE44F|nr:nucleoside triphosphate pyrophosphohydrolase [Phenylobacterium aquaticum]MCI3134469.1 nucleoside triphosphate pyrophosphohydrolase [Phenylobacterium aquaticum]